MTKQRACLSVVCTTETRVAPLVQITSSERNAVASFSSSLSLFVPWLHVPREKEREKGREGERDFWSSPKDRRIKISRLFDETVDTSASLYLSLFLFLLLMKSDE